MKKLVSLLLIFILLISVISLSVFALPAGAATAPVICGDMNYDGVVDVIDATLIQRSLVGSYECYMMDAIGDFDHDGERSVIDATLIQRKDAKIDIPAGCGGFLPDIHVTDLEASRESGEVSVDIPITFTASARTTGSFIEYEFYIDEVLVQPRSEKSSFTYTFTKRGRYSIEVIAYTDWGVSAEYSLFDYVVKDGTLYDDPPYISLKEVLDRKSDAPILHVAAKGGTAPYTYRFVLLRNTGEFYDVTGLTDEDIATYEQYTQTVSETGWQLGEQDGLRCLYRDYEESNEIAVPKRMLPYGENYSVQVSVIDANGIPSEYMNTGRYINSK